MIRVCDALRFNDINLLVKLCLQNKRTMSAHDYEVLRSVCFNTNKHAVIPILDSIQDYLQIQRVWMPYLFIYLFINYLLPGRHFLSFFLITKSRHMSQISLVLCVRFLHTSYGSLSIWGLNVMPESNRLSPPGNAGEDLDLAYCCL